MGRLSTTIKNTVYITIIFFSLLIIVSSLNLFGTQMFVVKSGSMEPEIQTGSIVFDKKNTEYETGDVITFKVPDSKDTVTHRIVEKTLDVKDDLFYTVKGDANNAVDPEPVSNASVIGKVRFTIPYLGYLVAFMKTLPGLILFVIIPATAIILYELVNIKTEVQNIRNAKKTIVDTVEKIEKELVEEEKIIINKLKGKADDV
jgi:signal peptidase